MISAFIATRRGRVVLATILIALIAVILGACSGETKKEPGAQSDPGSAAHQQDQPREIKDIPLPQAPDFELPRLEGGTLRLSDYRGCIVVLDFWATWCAPCRMSIPHLIQLQEAFSEEQVVVIGVALDRTGPEVVEKFADEFKITYPLVLGNPEVVAAYGNFPTIPVTFLINAQGEVVDRYVGFRPRVIYEAAIRVLLEESKAAK